MIAYENLYELNKPFHEYFKNRFADFLNDGWYILGKQLSNFEQEFARWNTSENCIGVANGLDALTLSLKAFDIEPGSEVIVPSNTYIATILSILNNNLVPVLAEPDIATYNIAPANIEKAITPKTKAVMIVHLYGKCCDMDAIMGITKKHGLLLIEDCAQAHGATFKGKKAGTFGDFGAFSFYPTKNLGALGDGGAITTDDENLAQKVAMIRNYGSQKKYYNEYVGVNSRLDEVQAAFLSIKLKHLDEINSYKQKLARLYLGHLKQDFILPVTHPDYNDVYHIFNIRHPRRNQLKEYLFNNGIGTEIHYPVAPHKQNALKNIFQGRNFPVAEEIHNTTLSLPCSYWHTTQQIEYIIDKLNAF